MSLNQATPFTRVSPTGAPVFALCYTVNEAHDAERLLALGIDGLITDAVDRFAPVPAPAP
jgi:hypothetical protein